MAIHAGAVLFHTSWPEGWLVVEGCYGNYMVTMVTMVAMVTRVVG